MRLTHCVNHTDRVWLYQSEIHVIDHMHFILGIHLSSKTSTIYYLDIRLCVVESPCSINDLSRLLG